MTDKHPNDLSERELEILRLVATGASNKEIAQQLFISTNTVKVHLRNIFAKVGVSSRTEAAMLMIRQDQEKAADVSAFQSSETDLASGTFSPLPISVSVSESLQLDRPQERNRKLWTMLLGFFLVSVLVGAAAVFNTRSAVPQAGTALPVETRSPSRWRALAALSAPRYGLSVAAYENHIYIFGGENDSGVTGLAERFEFNNNQYEPISPKPRPVADAGAAVIGGLIYIPGGRLLSGALTDVLEVYDPRQNTWERRASLPIPLSGYALTAFEGRLYLFGGWDGSQYLDTVYRYDPDSDAWKAMSPMPTARAFAGAAAAGGKIFVLGGFDGISALDINEVYIPEREAVDENPWLTAKSMPDSRYGMGITNVADFIQVIGGEDAQGKIILPAISYSASQDDWLLLEAPDRELGSFLGAAAYGGEIVVFGGKIGENAVDSSMVYQVIYTLSIPVIIK
jgi:DNA-binding CsgD family transcriptional regulator